MSFNVNASPAKGPASQHGIQPIVKPLELSIVVPTFNERDNVALLVAALDAALPDTVWEAVFVDDDSSDQTAALVRDIARTDPRVRCVHRYGRRGLSSACIEGMMATSAPFIAVVDGDMQHDERQLGAMLTAIRQPDTDIVIGSRYVDGGGFGDWGEGRKAMSRFATWLAQRATGIRLSDPMSGFFMVRREALLSALPRLSGIGFKILLDILASAPRTLHSREIPYEFRTRQFGESKLDAMVLWEYLLLLLDKSIGHIVPVRFISFALVGGSGVFVHFAILTSLFKGFLLPFPTAQGAATVVAISTNFFLNNLLTYRDRRLKGAKLLLGWLSFNLVCATGAIANVGIADWMFERHTMWVLSALAGIAVGVVWNYAMSSIFTWRKT